MKVFVVVAAGLVVSACGIKPDPPPEIPTSAYGGMGDIMSKCMQYASESICYRQTWGSDEN